MADDKIVVGLADAAWKILKKSGPATKSDWKARIPGISSKMDAVIAYLADAGRIEETEVTVKNRGNGRKVAGYKAIDPDPSQAPDASPFSVFAWGDSTL